MTLNRNPETGRIELTPNQAELLDAIVHNLVITKSGMGDMTKSVYGQGWSDGFNQVVDTLVTWAGRKRI